MHAVVGKGPHRVTLLLLAIAWAMADALIELDAKASRSDANAVQSTKKDEQWRVESLKSYLDETYTSGGAASAVGKAASPTGVSLS